MGHLLIGVIVGCFVVGLALDFLHLRRSAQRRLYWAAAALAAIAGFLLVYPNWETGLAIAGILFAAMTIAAYAATPYLKIGGNIYALTLADRAPDPQDSPTGDDSAPRGHDAPAQSADPPADPAADSYNGTLTPATVWWALVVLAGIAAVNVGAFLFGDGRAAPAAVAAGLVVLLAIAGGCGDASWGYRIARGQYLPFGVAAVITAGSFAVVYLAAYYVARRFPLRRKQSLQYRVHPRHRQPPP